MDRCTNPDLNSWKSFVPLQQEEYCFVIKPRNINFTIHGCLWKLSFPVWVFTSSSAPFPPPACFNDQNCILNSQRLLMDVRALTLTACVNNLHSSAIKGERGSLNHTAPTGGVSAHDTHMFAVTLAFSIFFFRSRGWNVFQGKKQRGDGGGLLMSRKRSRAEVVLASPHKISIVKGRNGRSRDSLRVMRTMGA